MENQIIFKIYGASKPKGLNMVVKTFCENAHAYIKAKSNGNSPVGLALKMEYFVQKLINDNGTILYFIKRNVDLSPIPEPV